MVKVLRKILGATIYASGLVFAAVVLAGGLMAKCVWYLTCVIAGGSN